MERIDNRPIILEETVREGFEYHFEESPYWKFKRGEIVPQAILDQDPVYRLMSKTVSETGGDL